MLKNAMSWSRARKEFLVSTSARPSVNPIEVTYQRVTICSIYKEGRTFFGVAVQHPGDDDNKKLGTETAMSNALISPTFVFPGKFTQGEFYRKAAQIYAVYEDALNIVQERTITEEEWLANDPNAPLYVTEDECCDCTDCPYGTTDYCDCEECPYEC